VPKARALGAPGDLSILAIEPTVVGGKTALAVAVRAPADADLFVEAPERWYLDAGRPQPAPGPGGETRFNIEILERPKEDAGTLDLRLTLVAGDRAIESSASLDTARLPR
jgi:hypothetical protein